MLINLTNHPSVLWSDKQIQMASIYGEIIDISFPNIPAEATTDDIANMARVYLNKIIELDKSAVVLCQGEMTFVVAMVCLLMDNGIKAVCATSSRVVKDVYENGVYKKISEFEFVGFREYTRI